MSKVFRVFIIETLQFHHDIEAANAYDAKRLVRDSLNRAGDLEPVEDPEGYSGYQVDDAMEIPRENSDLA